MKNKFSIIFMGTPDFAVPSLIALHREGYQLKRVITQPDRPKGRGRNPVAPPVKQRALDLNLDLLQPAKPNSAEFAEKLWRIQPDLLVVVAYGHLLSEKILQVPKIGAINVHASLLPKYRGPAPIQWAIINGETQTGVTTMFMDTGMDTGDILMSRPEPILSTDTAATLHDRLATLGADTLLHTLQQLSDQTLQPKRQDHDKATYAPLLQKQDGRIDWQKTAATLASFIRGMTPWPGAFAFHHQNRLKILKAAPIDEPASAPAGTILEGFPDELLVATGKGALSILRIQGPSGKRLAIADFMRGYQLPPGTRLS
ncbi:MAG: methionyl-tRNA formyltransferase [Desulfobacterales bacterium]